MTTLNLNQVNVTLNEFFKRNSQVSKKELASMLDVSAGTITKMSKSGMTSMQSLAIEALDKRLADHNRVNLDITEWFDKTYGNSYFSGYVYFKGECYFLEMQYGYGSHCEDMALKLLESKGLIPSGKRQYELMTEYNIHVKTDKSEVSRKRDLYNGSERTYSEVK